MEVRAIFAFVLALSLATALIPPLVRFAGPLGLIDRGGGRKVHAGLVPRTGGVAIFIGFLVPVLIWAPLRADLGAFVVASAVLFVFGIMDDRFNLDYRLKLLGQIIAALIVTMYGGILVERVPFVFGGMLPYALAVPFTVFALVGVTNAVNLSDGLDGLAGGTSLLALGCLLPMAYNGGDFPAVTAILAIMGATFGFLRFNTFPARLFMGDTGSQFLGFSSGVLAVIVTQQSDPALSPVVPILILGLPILDTLTVMVTRISRGRSPFEADRTHIHHRLLASGLSQYEAVTLVYSVQFLLVLLAYLLRYSNDGVILLTYAAFCVLTLLGTRELERRHLHLKSRDPQRDAIARLVASGRSTRFFTQFPFAVLSATIPFVLAAGALAVPAVSRDIGVLAAALLAALLAAVLIKPLPLFTVERLAAYSVAATVAYLVERTEGIMDACGLCVHLLYAGLAIVTAFWVRFSSPHFRVSTLDVLILLGALVAPSLRGLGFQQIGVVALESIVLFYGIEVIMQERERHWDPLRIGVLTALAVLTVKGLLL